jgi:hypothetical protein
MEPQRQGQPDELYRPRVKRRKHIRRRPKHLLLIVLVALSLLILPVGWKFYSLSDHRSTAIPPQAKAEDRRALVAVVNKMVSKTGQNVPPADLVVGAANLRSRDGQVYLTGAIQNRSSRMYSRVHIVFDTTDRSHNSAGVVEGDVSGVLAQKETSFEIGPINPLARWFWVRSIQPVE